MLATWETLKGGNSHRRLKMLTKSQKPLCSHFSKSRFVSPEGCSSHRTTIRTSEGRSFDVQNRSRPRLPASYGPAFTDVRFTRR